MALNYGLIGHRVRTLRKMQKMSQAVLAEHTGLSVPYISHIETGIKHVSFMKIKGMIAARISLNLRKSCPIIVWLNAACCLICLSQLETV